MLTLVAAVGCSCGFILVVALLATFSRDEPVPVAGMADRARLASAPSVANVVLSRLATVPLAATELLHAVAILNDRADLGVAAGCNGVHVGQDDLSPQSARLVVGEKLVGVSTHNLSQLREADQAPVDYIAIGPTFTTHSTQNPDTVVGHAQLDVVAREPADDLDAAGSRALLHPVQRLQGRRTTEAGKRRTPIGTPDQGPTRRGRIRTLVGGISPETVFETRLVADQRPRDGQRRPAGFPEVLDVVTWRRRVQRAEPCDATWRR